MKPNAIAIDLTEVPEDKRTDPRFLLLLADMERGCSDPRLVRAICIHEAAHVFFLGYAGLNKPSAQGPRILFDPVTNEFNGQGAVVKVDGRDDEHIARFDTREWLGHIAKGYAAGGVAARLLANSFDRGDGDDKDNFNRVFAMIKATNPQMTWTSESLWMEAGTALAMDLQRDDVRQKILEIAEVLQADLFPVS